MQRTQKSTMGKSKHTSTTKPHSISLSKKSTPKQTKSTLNRSLKIKAKKTTSITSSQQKLSQLQQLSVSSPFYKTQQHFSSQQPNRSNLKPLSTGINNLDQLEHLHGQGDLMNAAQLQLKAKKAEVTHQKKVALQQQYSQDGKVHVGQAASNEQIEAQLTEINQAANITPPPVHITHPQHSTYFLPMWDPSFQANRDLVGAFERTTNLKLEDMDLLGINVQTLLNPELNINKNNTTTTLRQRIQQKNHVSLVLIASTDATFEFSKVCSNLWTRQFEKHGISNQDGAIIIQPTLVSITEGFLSGFFNKSISKKVAQGLDPHYSLPHAFTFHIDKTDGPIARARRYLDCRNRYAANLFLVDERGMVRWKSRIATVPTKEFMETLFNVTNDLILETQFDEAD